MSKFDPEEKEILKAFEEGLFKRVRNRANELEHHREIAAATFKKDTRINYGLSSKDLRALQKRARAEGMPYQTLATSVLHKFVEGQLIDQTASNGSRSTRKPSR